MRGSGPRRRFGFRGDRRRAAGASSRRTLSVERCEPRCCLDSVGLSVEPAETRAPGVPGIDLSGAAFDTLVISGGEASVDLSGARFERVVNLASSGTVNLAGAEFGAFVNLAPGATIDLTGARFSLLENRGEGATIDLAGVRFDTLVNSAAGTKINLGGVDFKKLVKESAKINLAGVDFKTLVNTGAGATINLSGAAFGHGEDGEAPAGATAIRFDTLINSGANTKINLGGVDFKKLVNSGAGTKIDLAGIRFDTLVNSGAGTKIDLSGATFSSLVNRGGTGTRIDVQGGSFHSLVNEAHDVDVVRISGASFASVRNDGDRLGRLDVRGGDEPNTLLNDGSGVTILFVGGGGDDVFVNDTSCRGTLGGAVRIDVDLGDGNDRAVLGGTGIGGRVAGGAGDDTILFAGPVGGSLLVVEAPDADLDTLDFSRVTDGGIAIDLGLAAPQRVRPGFLLSLSDGAGIEAVVGTPAADTILGSRRSTHLLGADPGDDRASPSASLAGRTQMVFLDFDSASDEGERAYAAEERSAIAAGLNRVYDGFGVSFVLEPPAVAHATVVFNAPRPNGDPGGQASDIDFGNRDPGGLATVQLNGLLGLPGTPEATPANVVAAATWMAAHEVAHLMGLRHADAFGPVGFGVNTAPLEAGLSAVPAVGGAMAAWGTNDHVIATPAMTGFTFDDLVRGHFFGARESVKLAFARHAPTVADGGLLVAESRVAGFAAPQELSLHALPVPNAAPRGFEAGKELVVAAVAVEGAIDLPGERDLYRIEARAGDLLNLQVMSRALGRLAGRSFDAVLTVRDASGRVVATSDDEYESQDPSIVDLRIPSTGVFTLEVRGFDGGETGAYELFAWRFDTADRGSAADRIVRYPHGGSPRAEPAPPWHAHAWHAAGIGATPAVVETVRGAAPPADRAEAPDAATERPAIDTDARPRARVPAIATARPASNPVSRLPRGLGRGLEPPSAGS